MLMKKYQGILLFQFIFNFGFGQDSTRFHRDGFYLNVGVTQPFLSYVNAAQLVYNDGRGNTYGTYVETKNNQSPFTGILVSTGKIFESYGSNFSFQAGLSYLYSKQWLHYSSFSNLSYIHVPTPPLPYVRSINHVDGYIEESVFATDFNAGYKIGVIKLFGGLNPSFCLPKLIEDRTYTETYDVTPSKLSSSYRSWGQYVYYYKDSITRITNTIEQEFDWTKPAIKQTYFRVPLHLGIEGYVKTKNYFITLGSKVFLTAQSKLESAANARLSFQVYIGIILKDDKIKEKITGW